MPAAAQLVLAVEFASTDGRTWESIGGGDTVEAAVAFARASCPAGTSWRAVRWNDLYGD